MWNYQPAQADQHASGAQDYQSRVQQAADNALDSESTRNHRREKNLTYHHVPPLPEEVCETLRAKVIERERKYLEYLELNQQAVELRKRARELFTEAEGIRWECEKLAFAGGNFRPDIDQQLWGNPTGAKVYSAQFLLPKHIGKSHLFEAKKVERSLRNINFDEEG